jgi:hypothetical protein
MFGRGQRGIRDDGPQKNHASKRRAYQLRVFAARAQTRPHRRFYLLQGEASTKGKKKQPSNRCASAAAAFVKRRINTVW